MLEKEDVIDLALQAQRKEVEEPFVYLLERYMKYWRWGWVYPKAWKIRFWIDVLDVVTDIVDTMTRISKDDCIDLLVRKNAGYSNRPLLMLGIKGITGRCVAKVCRIQNVLGDRTLDQVGESVDDSVKDLYNYALLSILLLTGRLA